MNSTSDGEQTDSDFAELMSKRAQEEQQAVSDAFDLASTSLKQMMENSSDLTHLGYMMLVGYRLIQWAASKASEREGMTMLMLEILVSSQERKSREAFDVIDMINDFEKNQMPWLISQRNEAIMRRTARERRLKEFAKRLRRKDIQLPFHSMTKAVGDDGFTHESMLFLVGASDALRPVLRYCLREYQRAGGTAALLSNVPQEEDEKIAKLILPLGKWRNCAEIYSSALTALAPVSKGFPNKQIGMLGIDSLKETFLASMPPMDEAQRLIFAMNVFHQYQQERGIAMLVCVNTDEVPEGIDPMEVYPWLKDRPHVRVTLEDSKLVGGSRNIIVGNDVMVYDQLLERMKD